MPDNPMAWLRARLETMTPEPWVRNLAPAMLEVIEVAKRLAVALPYHNCRGPSCLLCVALPNALYGLDVVLDEEMGRG